MRYAFFSVGVLCCSLGVSGADWLTLPSTYSHDPASGERVSQYARVEAPPAPSAPNFRTSGYTHTRSNLQYGQSADNYHRVEKWGDPVRPYGEWQFPYRPYSSPYPNWGAPFASSNFGFGDYQGNYYGGALDRRNFPYSSNRGRGPFGHSPGGRGPGGRGPGSHGAGGYRPYRHGPGGTGSFRQDSPAHGWPGHASPNHDWSDHGGNDPTDHD